MKTKAPCTAWKAALGYGFCKDENGDSIFVHRTSLRNCRDEYAFLRIGQKVKLEKVAVPKGWEGYDVTPIESEEEIEYDESIISIH